jgi:peptidoglycan/xylan/chitin deacetylase (PgdA/CDA1 family)
MIFDYRNQWKTRSGLYDGSDPTQIALTFDDGPNDRHTLDLVDFLGQHGIKATFFMVGNYVRKRPEIARAVHKAGHIIGNHSESHPPRLRWEWLSEERLTTEINECQKAIEDVIGVAPTFFRPPYGSASPKVEIIAAQIGLKLVIWSVTACDWERNMTSGLIVTQVRKEIDSRRQGEVILLHDGGENGIGADRKASVAGVKTLIAHYSAAGKHFVPLTEFKF